MNDKSKLININEHFNPPDDIIQAISDLEMLFQISNQDVMKAYQEHCHKENFSGNLGDWIKSDAMKKYYTDINKPWSYLKRAIFLINNYSNKIDSTVFNTVYGDDLTKLINMIQSGNDAKNKVETWLSPLINTENAFEAIEDATYLDLNHRFQILELHTLDNDKSNKIQLFPHILQIKSPAELVLYLKYNEDIRNCLIVTIHYNPKREWKSFFYLFLIYNGKLYSIDNSDRRLNEDNTEGDRSPVKYLERQYDGVWLPFNLLTNIGGNPEKKELMLPNSSVFKIASFVDYAESSPEYIYWLNVFIKRIIDHIDENKIPKGITNADLPKLLTSGNIPEYKSDMGVYPDSSGSYLLDIYKEKITSLVIKETDFSMVVGTREHVENLIAYKGRHRIAENIVDLVWKDFNKNCLRVYSRIADIVSNVGVEKIINKAFLDKEYTFEYFAQCFTDRGAFCENEAIEGTSEIRKHDILERISWTGKSEGTNFVLNKDFSTIKGWECLLSPNRSNLMFNLHFKDYRQFIEFFELKKEDIPIEMVQHLHQQSGLYTGNWILNDTDPLDRILDPWFKYDEPNEKSWGWSGRQTPHYYVKFALCKRCVKKLCRKLGVDSTPWVKPIKFYG